MNLERNAKQALAMIGRWKSETEGNIAIIFALLTIPLFLLMGFAVDLQQVNTSKNRVQYILDSAVIAGAREMQAGKSDEKIKKYIENYFESAMKAQGNNVDCADPVSTILSDSQDISVTVKCDQPTSIMHLMGTREIAFGVTSASTYGIGKVDIAFVFDVSGSMYGSKMTALKDAADTAIDVLIPEDDDGTTGEVRISMASYSSMVDAGDDYFKKVTNLNPSRTYYYTYTDRQKVGEETYCSRYNRRGECRRWSTRDIYDDVEVTESKTINNTCVKERIGDEQFTDEDPGAYAWIEAAEAYGYMQNGRVKWYEETCNPIGPLPMTSNRDKLFDYIDDLNATGGTAGHLGIAWGWYLIAPDWDTVWPAGSDPYPYDEPDSAKAMIIMTDGEFNTQYDSSEGNSFEQSQKMCDAIKAEDIKVYTVAFNAPKAGQQILAYCASGDDFAFTPESSEELVEAYTKIAQSISDLRIRY